MADLPVVIAPTEFEASFLRRIARGRARITVSGIGPERLRATLEPLAPETPAVILAGIAGALHPLHSTGAPRIRAVIERDGAHAIPNWCGPWPGHDEATILGVDSPAWTVEDKAALGASTGADLVDCESHALAAWARAANVPWGVLRGVSDGPVDELPSITARWIDQRGRAIPLAIARDLIARPSLIPTLRRIQRASTTAMQDVAPQVDRLLDMIRAVDADARRDSAPRVGLIPVDPAVKRLVIFGGTFDPPHRAHVDLSLKAMKALNADAMLIVPAARSPHKDAGPATPDADRVAMLELAYRGKPGVGICTLELERARESDPSFTIDTLEALQRELGTSVQMRLLIGADQAAAFHRWREVDRILAIAPPAVLLRPPIDSLDELDKRLRHHWTPKQMAFWKSWIVPAPVSKISATNVRQSTQRSQGDLPPPVARYIEARALYRGAPEPAHG